MGPEAWIWASRMKFGPRGWDLVLKARIWVGGGMEKEKKEKKKEEKIPHMCESIGHRPLWGRCPKKGKK